MIYYDRIDVSEGINVNKTSASKECDVCRYWSWFINDVCETSGIAILNIKGSDYRRSSSLISKNEAINVMQNVEPKKVEHHKT